MIKVPELTKEEALAEAWASIDGKLDAFRREHARSRVAPLDREEDGYTGHYEGYMAEAEEMIVRLRARGYVITPLSE
jgi:hypothetical protein